MEEDKALVKKKRDEAEVERARQELAEFQERALAGEIVLGYVDETGVSAVHPNRSAWTVKGDQHLVEAVRGKRLNIIGALMSDGELVSATVEKNMDSGLFVGFLGMVLNRYDKPIVLVVDNCSIHTAKKIDCYINYFREKGLELYFLPTYSPELNRIEVLWRMMKHKWLEVKHRTWEVLNREVEEILNRFGESYKFSFWPKTCEE